MIKSGNLTENKEHLFYLVDDGVVLISCAARRLSPLAPEVSYNGSNSSKWKKKCIVLGDGDGKCSCTVLTLTHSPYQTRDK